MSRHESVRRRLTAQIDGLSWAIEQIRDLSGDILELGLRSGRTQDHLREYADRRIWAIGRVLQCHPSCVPPETDFLQEEANTMLKRLADDGARITLAYYDFGFNDKARDVEVSENISLLIAALMVPGGIVISQEPLVGFEQIRGPDNIDRDRYPFYRAG